MFQDPIWHRESGLTEASATQQCRDAFEANIGIRLCQAELNKTYDDMVLDCVDDLGVSQQNCNN